MALTKIDIINKIQNETGLNKNDSSEMVEA
jgi:hypothetical protein